MEEHPALGLALAHCSRPQVRGARARTRGRRVVEALEEAVGLGSAGGVLLVAGLTVVKPMTVEAGGGTEPRRLLRMGRDEVRGVRHRHLVTGVAVLLDVVALGARGANP